MYKQRDLILAQIFIQTLDREKITGLCSGIQETRNAESNVGRARVSIEVCLNCKVARKPR